ncbi:MAG: hypothetical protein EA367_00560 [Leptolyngbya sp. DLM2.Bin15]|nr:MAG: hypothetical protein EA367_00560 [Leptolyngbya sp. DLM2.Bin15]
MDEGDVWFPRHASDEWLCLCRKEWSVSDNVYIFAHIPKTGGTTLRRHFERHLKPHSTFIHLASSGERKAVEKKGLAPFAQRSEEERNKAQVILGHLVDKDTYKLVPGRTPKHVIFWREPVSWVASRYNWVMNSNKNKGEPVIDFDVWYNETEQRQSQIFWFLRHYGKMRMARFKSPAKKLDAAYDLLSTFSMVSLTERLNDDAPMIFRLLGVPEEFKSANVAGVRHEKLLTPSDELREKLSVKLAPDIELYEALKAKPSKIEL